MKVKRDYSYYVLEKLISGDIIGKDGYYAAVPDIGYKGHPFTIKHYYRSDPDRYSLLELEVKDWNKAEAFRKMPQTIPGKSGWYTLGYFKMPEKG